MEIFEIRGFVKIKYFAILIQDHVVQIKNMKKNTSKNCALDFTIRSLPPGRVIDPPQALPFEKQPKM